MIGVEQDKKQDRQLATAVTQDNGGSSREVVKNDQS